MARSEAEKRARERELATVIQSNRGKLLATIGRTLRDQVEAEDVLQETIADFIEQYDVGDAIVSASGWLMRVAKNKVLDRFRRRKTRDDNEDELLLEEFANEQPDEDFERAVLQAQLVEALEALPSEQREVFVMHELEGKSFEEIAALTGVGVNTLLSRKRYATLFLREYLKEVYDEYE